MTDAEILVAASPTLRVIIEPDEDAPSPLLDNEPLTVISWVADTPSPFPAFRSPLNMGRTLA